MLTCLVAIPLAAVFGTPLPQMFRALGEGRWNDCWELACNSFSEADRSASTTENSSHPAPTHQSAAEPARLPVVGAGALDQLQPNPAAGPAVALGYPAGASQSEAIPASFQTAADTLGVPVNGMPPSPLPAVPSGRTGRLPPVDQATTPDMRQPTAAPTDRFVYIQDRLRHLGATYYLLESWGSQGELYRFYCKMAVGGNSTYNRYFEATDADALQAMAKVLAEVEAWKSGRP
jgi:hypothetical protein